MYDINKEYICVSSINCSLDGKKGKEKISRGTSILFIDNDYRFKKKNGTRIYKADDLKIHVDITKLGISLYFVPFEKLKYKGIDSDLLGLKQNKDYIYGGDGTDGVRLFIKRFSDSEFVDLTDFEFQIYFKEESKTSKEEYNKCLKFIDYKINELKKHLDSYCDGCGDCDDFTYKRLDKLFKSYKEREYLLIKFKENLFLN